jgi:hypothetical protein
MEPNLQPEGTQGTQGTQETSAGPVIAIVIILVVIVLGGLYFWSERKNDTSTGPYGSPAENLPAENGAGATDDTTSAIEKQSTSDSLDSIEADLQNTNTVDVDGELYSS